MWSYVRLGEDVVIDGIIVVDVVGVNRGGSGEHGATRGNGCVVVVVSCEGLDVWVGLCGVHSVSFSTHLRSLRRICADQWYPAVIPVSCEGLDGWVGLCGDGEGDGG